jgi:hypothetical protein
VSTPLFKCRSRLKAADTDYTVPISRISVGHNCDQATGPMPGILGSISSRESDPGILHTAPPALVTGAIVPGIKWLKRESDHSLAYYSEIKNGHSATVADSQQQC